MGVSEIILADFFCKCVNTSGLIVFWSYVVEILVRKKHGKGLITQHALQLVSLLPVHSLLPICPVCLAAIDSNTFEILINDHQRRQFSRSFISNFAS